MAATDARAIPQKNTALRVTFPIFDADGDLVSGATGLDSEVSKDGGAFADCTSEATEIGSSGMYFLDLTSTEMNADTVVVIVKTTSAGAKTTPIVLYTAARSINDLAYPIVTGRGTDVELFGGVRTYSMDADSISATSLATTAVTEIVDAVWAKVLTEPTGEPTFASAASAHLAWLMLLSLAKITSDSNSVDVRNMADSGTVATFATSDDGTTMTSGAAT